MKYMPIVAILIFFTSILDASSYARSIRVGSFLKESRAEKELVKLENFVQSNDRLSDLQEKYQFKIKLLVRGKYYLNVIEPLMKKDVVQEILDILRTEYSYVYPKKIRYLPEYANYGQKKVVQVQKEERVEESIDDSELLEKVDQILEDGKIEEDTQESVKRTNHLRKMEAVEDESSIFDIFSFDFSFDFFSSSDESEEKEKIIEEIVKKENKNIEEEKSFIVVALDTIMNYILEIILAIAIVIMLVLLKLYITYRKENKDKISMQDIYS